MPALSASNIGPAAAALMASELMARGRKSAAALEALLQLDASTTTTAAAPPGQQPHHGIRELAEQILCCFDRALAALHGDDGGVDVDRDEATGVCCPSKKRRSAAPPGAAALASWPKRRSSRGIGGAGMPTRVEKRSTPDDGFLWRKYGQKDILNSKYPRTYFRCTYKYDNNGCKATRQVQQSEDDPSVYIVTYFDDHTCGMDAGAATATVGGNEKSPQSLVISFGSGTTSSSGSPWFSSSVEDGVGSNSSVFSEALCLPEDAGEQNKANNACNIESSVLLPPAAAPSSSADDVSCASPDLLDSSLLHYFDWDDYCGLSLLPCSIWNS